MISNLNIERMLSLELELKKRRDSLGWIEDGCTLPPPDSIQLNSVLYSEYDHETPQLRVGHKLNYCMYPEGLSMPAPPRCSKPYLYAGWDMSTRGVETKYFSPGFLTQCTSCTLSWETFFDKSELWIRDVVMPKVMRTLKLNVDQLRVLVTQETVNDTQYDYNREASKLLDALLLVRYDSLYSAAGRLNMQIQSFAKTLQTKLQDCH